MPELSQTECKHIIKEKINAIYLINNTSIFLDDVDFKYCEKTRESIKRKLSMFLESWVSEAVETLK